MNGTLYYYRALLVRVIDGDTVIVDLSLGLNVWHKGTRIRLARINAPEMNTPEGKVSQGALEEMLANRTLIIQTIKDRADDYGRLLGELWVGSENINDLMMAKGFAKPYGKEVQK